MNKNKIKIAIMAISSIMMVPMALSPILAAVAKAFPTAPIATVQMIAVLPGLVSLPFSLVTGRLATVVAKKTILLCAMTIILFGGLMPLFFHGGLGLLLAASAVLGMGQGFLTPICVALIADHFAGHERSHLMGIQSAVINGGGMVMVILSGLLARIDWSYAYSVFLLIIPALIVVAILMPTGPVSRPVMGGGFGLSRTVAYISAVALCFGILFTTYNNNVALYLDAAHLGDTSSAGLATSLFTAAGIVTGLSFGRLFRAIQRFAIPLAGGLAALGLLLAFIGGSLPVVFVGGILVGSGFSIMMPLGTFLATQASAAEASALAVAVFTASVSVGSFVSPFMVNGLASLIGPGDERGRFLVAALGLLALCALTLGKEVRSRRQVAALQLPE
jgi:MFS family permease